MERIILHVDVNNAFLSWTAVHKLECGETFDIRTVPSIIGGDESQRHGIVLAKSMPAKALGIVTAEPICYAKRKCKNLLVFPADFSVYKKYSYDVYNILSTYTDKIERFSIDECFLDMTNSLMGRGILDIAKEISDRIAKELKFTVNIGVAHNKLLAKMASDFQKPNKIHTLLSKQEVEEKMWGLPVIELFMVGKNSINKLNDMGIKTIGDLAKTDPKILTKRFGKFGLMMYNYANGIDDSEINYQKHIPKRNWKRNNIISRLK
ncbi:MAG: DNA polymerase IV [Lachnospiraceae bacterium]|jgi:DNA polymerase-4|nr:DNA polymerase IV [Lachnospiraceae bacterium]